MQEPSAPHSRGLFTPDAAFRECIHKLWDDLAAFEAARSDSAVRHLLAIVAGMVDAQNAYWMGAVRMTEDDRDPMLGWRPRVVRYLSPSPKGKPFTRDRVRSRSPGGGIDQPTSAHVRLAGSYRARRLCDIVSPGWFDSDEYAAYVGQGVHDVLVVGVPVSKTVEAYYGFLRMRTTDRFTVEQRDNALYAMRGLTWFHRKVLLAEGLLATRSPLSPMERKVLSLLLTEHSEKVIAASLEVAPTTLHTYVRDVFRKFDVSGRNGLTALWLGSQS